MADEQGLSRDEAGAVLREAATRDTSDRLTVAEVKVAGAEVGVSGEEIDAAIGRRAEAKAAREARRRTVRTWSLWALAAVVVYFIAVAVLTHADRAQRARVAAENISALKSAAREVDLRRSSVREALERQRRVEALMATQSDDSMRAAELLGAQNRVSVAMRRYDAAVYRYNGASTRWTLSRSYSAYPARYAFSQEVSRW